MPLRDLPLPSSPAELYIRPAGLLTGEVARSAVASELAVRLAGGRFAFGMAEVAVRHGDGALRAVAPLQPVLDWAAGLPEAFAWRAKIQLAALAQPQKLWAGLRLDRPLVMGIVNVTPDSFSDGGDFAGAENAIAHGRALLEAGADILDIGGESTRPGAAPVAPEEELARVLPVIQALAAEGAVISVDTRHAAVMRGALAAGARIVNDITALSGDAESMRVVAEAGCPVVLMHMQGEPQTMQASPGYRDPTLDVFDILTERVEAAEAFGIAREAIAIDPGIGFGKNAEHNLHLLRHTGQFHALGAPILVGVSRKRFIAGLSRNEPPKQRLGGSLAAGLAALDQGAQILRVHDVAETAQAVAMWAALHG
ncbi:dihydropteroate synthase [Indioceanicola profundi]|uniref:dihydropteroate synthase n=1 Tax=Indioceanicola profundi TaxID=2220096 RepID=UPI000E6AAE97|nr:dihydropteroate synthase [Indioceanicola profundi]